MVIGQIGMCDRDPCLVLISLRSDLAKDKFAEVCGCCLGDFRLSDAEWISKPQFFASLRHLARPKMKRKLADRFSWMNIDMFKRWTKTWGRCKHSTNLSPRSDCPGRSWQCTGTRIYPASSGVTCTESDRAKSERRSVVGASWECWLSH